MSPSRHVLPLLTGILAIAAGSRVAGALTSDPVPAEDRGPSTDDENGEGGAEDAAIAAPMPVAFVEVSGGATGALRSAGEARTTWRYGRARGLPVDEATNRLRISGTGRALDGASRGLYVGFSVAILVPALRVGTYAAGALTRVATAWARQD